MSQPNAAHPPLEGAKLVIGTIAVSLAVFMNVLETCPFRRSPVTSGYRRIRARG